MRSTRINAKNEFLEFTKGLKIIAAEISFGDDYFGNDSKYSTLKLKPAYSKEEYENFLIFLDREYDCGYGGQELFGQIFCEDGIWFNRGEYDGSEWWCMNKYPNLRDHFDERDIIKYERNKKLKRIEESF